MISYISLHSDLLINLKFFVRMLTRYSKRFVYRTGSVFESKQDEFHNQIATKMDAFIPELTMNHRTEIAQFIQQQNRNIPSCVVDQISTEFIDDAVQYGTYHALSNPSTHRLNLVEWYMDTFVDLSVLPPALSSHDALRYSKPNSIEYEESLRFMPLGFDIKYYGNHSFIKIENNTGISPLVLPHQNEENNGKKLLLLDLDGSLIDRNVERPFLKQFFEFVSTKFEIAIHSAGYDMDCLIDEWNRNYCDGHITYYICKSCKWLQPFAKNRSCFLHFDDIKVDGQLRWINMKPFSRYDMEDDILLQLMEWLEIYETFAGTDSQFVKMFPSDSLLGQSRTTHPASILENMAD
eukprot:209299_1